MNVLFFGDTFSKPGRDALKKAIPELKSQRAIDFIIVNAENAAHGHGLLPDMADEMLSWNIDVLTMGNHTWDQKSLIPYLQQHTNIIRPANYPNFLSYKTPGRGSTVVYSKNNPHLKLGVIQIMGRVFMETLDCPFQVAQKEVEHLENLGVQCIIIDFHAEATSEKQAFAHFMDGKVSAVIGTHSHVQTADERILPQKTATITDVGLCGCFDSVIGVKKELSIEKFITKRPIRFEPADGLGGYSAVLIQIDEKTGQAQSIERLKKEIA